MIKESYKQQVSLLLAIMPIIAKEPQFAIHGGTAINLFEMDMPRLSVDVDLTFIPYQFIGMSDTPFSYEDYEKARQQNIDTVNKSLTDSNKNFLLSFLKGEPKWTENYNFSQYPPIRWKLMNLEKLKALNLEKFNRQVELLEKVMKN
ncbi:hypothetical protein FACS189413_19070 [Bacteroidia bacterium]|nr:hypothetical protein FACS189413_19070 [Bacteroidia bacterium]